MTRSQNRPTASWRLRAAGATALACAVYAPGALAESAAGERSEFTWAADLATALEQAKKEEKLVLLDFYTDWCGWCKRMDREVFAKDSFKTAASKVIGVKVNAEKNRKLAQQFKVSAYPRLFFLDAQGRTIERVKGYMNLPDFTRKVGQVQSGESEFVRLRQAAADPNNIGAVRSFADFLTDTGQVEESIPYWQTVHDIALQRMFEGTDASQSANSYYHRTALLRLGEAFDAIGLDDVARQNLREVFASYPESREAPAALLALAELDVKSGNPEQAGRHLETLTRDYPRTREAQQARLLHARVRAAARTQEMR